MSYLRPLNLQPDTLRQCALDSWLRHLLQLIRDNQIIARGKPLALSPSYHLLEDCLKVKKKLKTLEYSAAAECHLSSNDLYQFPSQIVQQITLYFFFLPSLQVLVNYSSSAVQHPSHQHTQHQHQVRHHLRRSCHVLQY